MEEDWLSKCVIDPSKRKVYLYSEGGEKRTVDCDTVQEFMNVLRFVRSTTSEDMILCRSLIGKNASILKIGDKKFGRKF